MIKTPEGYAVIEGDTHIGKWVAEQHRLDHDHRLLSLLLPYIPKGGTVVDIGAHIGTHSFAYLRQVGGQGIVYSFEPNPAAFECLITNCPQAIAVKCALGQWGGTRALHVDPLNSGASRTEIGGSLPVLPLDAFHFARLDFIKLDCEGDEYDVLMGARDTLAKHKPVLLVEISAGHLARNGRTPDQIFEFLTRHGYRYANVFSDDPMNVVQCDALCLPVDKSS